MGAPYVSGWVAGRFLSVFFFLTGSLKGFFYTRIVEFLQSDSTGDPREEVVLWQAMARPAFHLS